MRKHFAVAAGVLAILALALAVSNRADAGASASAPSKYGNQASSHSYPITEYSSSTRRTSYRHH
jgi:hypothetical protein